MNVGIGAEAALFPEKEEINGIAVAVYYVCVTVEMFYSVCLTDQKITIIRQLPLKYEKYTDDFWHTSVQFSLVQTIRVSDLSVQLIGSRQQSHEKTLIPHYKHPPLPPSPSPHLFSKYLYHFFTCNIPATELSLKIMYSNRQYAGTVI
jgi:hypothetical protein